MIGARGLRNRLVYRGVEGLAYRLDGFHIVALESLLKLTQYQIDALDDALGGLRFGALRVCNGALEIVDDRQHVLENLAALIEARVSYFPSRALAKIFQVGAGANKTIVVVVLGGFESVDLCLQLRDGIELCRVDFFARLHLDLEGFVDFVHGAARGLARCALGCAHRWLLLRANIFFRI